MNVNEREKLNDIINELCEAIEQYESLNETWFTSCLEDREYSLLIGALIPLASMQRASEKLQQLWVQQ